MKKRFIGTIICAIMAVAMVFGITGCNKNNDNTPATYTVTFNVQGHGTAPQAQAIDEGGHANEPQAPTETGWTFGGWYKEEGCTNKYNFATETVTANITLYAKWTKLNISDLATDKTPTLYLAGDSTVQTYKTEQYIAGWGQYLSYFLKSEVEVVNAARGGRSSRSFINEGRLYKYGSYSFSENNKKSIEETIKAGDFLFIQFGHNDDDTKKASSYSTMYDRMVPLGTPDANGIYPVTAPTNGAAGRDDGRNVTTYLPEEYTSKVSSTGSALNEIKKYGDYYYAYDCGGTYKWFLKQYIDFAREKGAIPVLLTPVARVSFNSDGTLKDGPGQHGTGFAYVKAVRQLAEEENCLLIDNFAATKTMLETATKSDSDFFMALVDNDALTGTWPEGYDDTYANRDKYESFSKVEATHYNKYGAYLTAAYVAASILQSNATNVIKGVDGTNEYFTFGDSVKTMPNTYVNPSYLMSKAKVALIEALSIFGDVKVTDPERKYPAPASVVTAINELTAVEVTTANYGAQTTAYNTVKALYNTVNADDRSGVTNYNDLLEYGAKILNAKIAAQLTGNASVQVTSDNYKQYNATCKALRKEYNALSSSLQAIVTNVSILTEFEAAVKDNEPQVTSTVVLDLSSLTANTSITSSQTCGDFTIVGANDKAVTVAASGTTFSYNNQSYTTTKSLSMGGSATFGTSRYVEFTTTATCRITVVAKSSGSDDRKVNLVSSNATSTVITTFAAGATQSITTYDDLAAGTYQLGSAGNGMYIYSIIIEYFS